jgi:hypothetical protein
VDNAVILGHDETRIATRSKNRQREIRIELPSNEVGCPDASSRSRRNIKGRLLGRGLGACLTPTEGALDMDSAKYIGLDVHKESTSIAVLNAARRS